MKKSIDIDDVIQFLNGLLTLDRRAIDALIEARVLCNEELAQHESVQVLSSKRGKVNSYYVGLLGILNGLYGVNEDGWGPIVAIYKDGELIKFTRTDGYHPGVE